MIPNCTIQWSRKVFTMCIDDALDMGIARVSLKCRSVMTLINWLPWFVLVMVMVYPSQ